MDVATSAFKHLLSANSKQSLSQQTAFLREYLTVFRVSIADRILHLRTLKLQKLLTASENMLHYNTWYPFVSMLFSKKLKKKSRQNLDKAERKQKQSRV